MNSGVAKRAHREVNLYYNVPKETKEGKLYPSTQGKLIEISYKLRVYVKHTAWNEYGRGKVVTFPIKILESLN